MLQIKLNQTLLSRNDDLFSCIPYTFACKKIECINIQSLMEAKNAMLKFIFLKCDVISGDDAMI